MGKKQTGNSDTTESLIKDASVSIDQKLIEEGTAQLASEISVLESWLEELESSEDDDLLAARKSYNDMLQSRREMLSSLAKQAKLQAVDADASKRAGQRE